MTDTHTHLYTSCYGEGAADAIRRAIDAGVSRLVIPNVDMESIDSISEVKSQFPDQLYVAMGLHPTEVASDYHEVLNHMEGKLNEEEYVAVGEIGLDLHWEQDKLSEQQDAFRRQLLMAERLKLPVIIHSRDALEQTLEIIREVNPSVALVFHSFTGNGEDVRKIREICDPCFGINGVVTYKNAGDLRDALPEIGLDRILLETDSPFLSPVPHRGKRNESAYLIHVLDKIAEVLGVPPAEVEQSTDKNAGRVFNI